MDSKIKREVLIQDVKRLTEILETAHPDPYFYGGGKIAYHRALQELVRDIPQEGMTRVDFYYHLLPFIARLEDGHTVLMPEITDEDRVNPRGIPLYFEPIDEKLFVGAVTKEEYHHLVGSILVSVEGVPLSELVARFRANWGCDNIYHLLGNLGMFGALYFGKILKRLIHEWKDEDQIEVVLRHVNGKEKKYVLTPSQNVEYPLLRLESKEIIDKKGRKISYHYLGKQKNIAYLHIDDMSSYREAHEYWHNIGLKKSLVYTKGLYKRIHNEESPEDINLLLAGIPAATEVFQSLFEEMKKKRTEHLIIDLRKCIGGYDAIITFFLYFLVGLDKTIDSYMQRAEVQKYSRFLFEQSGTEFDEEESSFESLIPKAVKDYDFSFDNSFQMNKDERKKKLIEAHKTEITKMPTFYKVYKEKNYEAFYKPAKIIVLTSNVTRSSAFDMMMNLKRFGAKSIGIPSSQSGNCFGNVRSFELENTKIKGIVSTKYFTAFPEKPLEHLIHTPNYQLTYEKLSAYKFDENASLLFALCLIEEGKI